MRTRKVKIIKNLKGSIYKIFGKKDLKKKPIKEVYFNEISSKKETLWIKHKKLTCHIYVTNGFGKLLVKKNKQKIRKISIREFDNKQIIIQSNTWFKIINFKKNKLIFLNYTDYPHNKNEYEKKEKI